MLAQSAGLGPDTGPNSKASLEGVIRPHIATCRPPRRTVVKAERTSLPLPAHTFLDSGGKEVGRGDRWQQEFGFEWG